MINKKLKITVETRTLGLYSFFKAVGDYTFKDKEMRISSEMVDARNFQEKK